MPVRAVLERDDAGRGDDPGLAHPAADHLAGTPGALDERASPTTTEPTGQPRLFDRQNVAEAPGGTRSRAGTPSATEALNSRAPSMNSGTPISRATSATDAT